MCNQCPIRIIVHLLARARDVRRTLLGIFRRVPQRHIPLRSERCFPYVSDAANSEGGVLWLQLAIVSHREVLRWRDFLYGCPHEKALLACVPFAALAESVLSPLLI